MNYEERLFEEIENNDDDLKVGVVGYSAQSFDEEEAEDAIDNIFDDIEDEYIASGEFKTVTIVSNLTKIGISKIAYEVADDRSYNTVGIAPDEAEESELYDVDEIIWVGKTFGEESETFIDYIDILVKIGGGEQSQNELEMADEEGIPIWEYDI